MLSLTARCYFQFFRYKLKLLQAQQVHPHCWDQERRPFLAQRGLVRVAFYKEKHRPICGKLLVGSRSKLWPIVPAHRPTQAPEGSDSNSKILLISTSASVSKGEIQ